MTRDRDATLAMIAAILVLFTAMLDARVSAILSIIAFVAFVAFAIYTYFGHRSAPSE